MPITVRNCGPVMEPRTPHIWSRTSTQTCRPIRGPTRTCRSAPTSAIWPCCTASSISSPTMAPTVPNYGPVTAPTAALPWSTTPIPAQPHRSIRPGHPPGTLLPKDSWAGKTPSSNGLGAIPNSSNPNNLANVNGRLYFTAADADHGTELWTSDGTTGGTILAAEINPGPAPGFLPWS